MHEFVITVLMHFVCGGIIYKIVEPHLSGLPNGWRLFFFAIAVAFYMELIKVGAVFLLLSWIVQVVSWFVGVERVKEWLDEAPE